MGRSVGVGVARAMGVAACALSGVVFVGSPAVATAPNAWCKGETMTYVVAADPGSAYDTYGRLVARYLGKHLGLAKIFIKHVPGDGHIVGANALYAARPDGFTIGTFNTGLIYAQLLGLDQVQFDLEKMSWIGKASDEPRFLTVSSKSGFRTLDDVRKSGKSLAVGAAGFGASSYNDMRLLAYVFDLDARYVLGLTTRDAQLAMKRGELDAHFGSAISHRPFITQRYGRALLRVGSIPGTDESIPDASALATTEERKAAVALVRAQAMLLRMTAGPPGIPGDRLLSLREAYMAALSDPGLLAEARKLDVRIAPMDGATLAVRVREALEQPASIVEMVKASGARTGAPGAEIAASLVAVEDGGRSIRFLVYDVEFVSSVDDSTEIVIDEAPGTRAGLAVGMPCRISLGHEVEQAAQSLRCRSPKVESPAPSS